MPKSNRQTEVGVYKFGTNPDVDTASTPETLWYPGALYPWASVASPFVPDIVSSSVNDKGTPTAGTGARTVTVQGLASDWTPLEETVTLDGTTPVALTGTYRRIFRAFCIAVGSGGVNAGSIDVRSAGVPVANIPIGFGQTQQAVYTVPGDVGKARLIRTWSAIEKAISTEASLELRTRNNAVDGTPESWRVMDTWSMSLESGIVTLEHTLPILFLPRTDLEMQIVESGSNDSRVSGGFELEFWT